MTGLGFGCARPGRRVDADEPSRRGLGWRSWRPARRPGLPADHGIRLGSAAPASNRPRLVPATGRTSSPTRPVRLLRPRLLRRLHARLPVRPVAGRRRRQRAGRHRRPDQAAADHRRPRPRLRRLVDGPRARRQRAARAARRRPSCVVNPITWFDSVIWGQVDSFGIVFLLLGRPGAVADRPERAAIFAVVAALDQAAARRSSSRSWRSSMIRRAMWPRRRLRRRARAGAERDRLRLGAADRRRGPDPHHGRRGVRDGGRAVRAVRAVGVSLRGRRRSSTRPRATRLQHRRRLPVCHRQRLQPVGAVPGQRREHGEQRAVGPRRAQSPTRACGARSGRSPRSRSAALLLRCCCSSVVPAARRPPAGPADDPRRACVLALAFFVVPTRVHERYLFPFFALGAILFAFSWRWRVAYVVALRRDVPEHVRRPHDALPATTRAVRDWLGIGDAFRRPGGRDVVALAPHRRRSCWALVQLRAARARALARRARPRSLDDGTEDVGPRDGGRGPRLARRDGAPGPPRRAGARAGRRGRRRAPAPAPRPDAAAGRRARPARGADVPTCASTVLARRRARSAGSAAGSTSARSAPTGRACSTASAAGRLDRLDLWILVVLVVRDARPAHVPPRRAVPDALRRGLPRADRDRVPAGLALRHRHDIYEWTHPHLAKYAMAGGIVAVRGDDHVAATSELGVAGPRRGDRAAPRRPGSPATGPATGVWVATGDERPGLRPPDARRSVATLAVAGRQRGRRRRDGARLFVGTDDGRALDDRRDDARRASARRARRPPSRAEPVGHARRRDHPPRDVRRRRPRSPPRPDDARRSTLDPARARSWARVQLAGVARHGRGGHRRRARRDARPHRRPGGRGAELAGRCRRRRGATTWRASASTDRGDRRRRIPTSDTRAASSGHRRRPARRAVDRACRGSRSPTPTASTFIDPSTGGVVDDGRRRRRRRTASPRQRRRRRPKLYVRPRPGDGRARPDRDRRGRRRRREGRPGAVKDRSAARRRSRGSPTTTAPRWSTSWARPPDGVRRLDGLRHRAPRQARVYADAPAAVRAVGLGRSTHNPRLPDRRPRADPRLRRRRRGRLASRSASTRSRGGCRA